MACVLYAPVPNLTSGAFLNRASLLLEADRPHSILYDPGPGVTLLEPTDLTPDIVHRGLCLINFS